MSIKVTQADRKAAASVAVLSEMRDPIRAGRADHLAEPWAKHRQQAVAAEVAQIVAWLRKDDLVVFTNVLADVIERGEYKETSGE